jgi:hypothetical protein
VAVDFLQVLAEMGVDTSKFEQALEKSERQAEQSAKKISGHFNVMAIGIATALAGTVMVALEQAIKKTAEYGLEMEHLGNRLGMTAQQAAVLTGVLEKQGIGANVAARAFQIMAMEAKQTGDSLDPFSTRLGKVLGTLRDTDGKLLNTAQIFDLARDKIRGAGDATQQLQMSQQIFGSRMGGQLLPVLKMTNEEWGRQKQQVESALGPVDKAAEAALQYKSAMAGLEQEMRGVQLTIGTKLIPTLAQWINDMQGGLHVLKEWISNNKVLSATLGAVKEALNFKIAREGASAATELWLKLGEAVHLYDKGTADNFAHMAERMQESADAEAKNLAAKEREKDLQAAIVEGVQLGEKVESQKVKIAGDIVKLKEKEFEAGAGSRGEIELAVEKKLLELTEQRAMLEKDMGAKGLTEDQQLDIEDKLMQNKLAAIDVVAQKVKEQYKDEEAELKAQGMLNIENEIQLLQKRLADERIVGNERLKIEGDLYEKRKQLAEDSVKAARDLGFMSIDQELEYRKQKAAVSLGKGDVVGAAQELKKIQDLQIKGVEQVAAFTKKIRIVSLQEEMDVQKQKLAMIKGNAEEEMKVIGQIADLDKQLYEKRLELGLTYTNTIIDQYTKMMNLGKKGSGETMTFDQAHVDAQRKLVEETRKAREVSGAMGGTEEERNWAVQWAQGMMKKWQDMLEAGQKIDSVMQDAFDQSKETLKAGGMGEEVRAPGGPSPTVGSIMSSTEGLSTQGLARGSDIPRLDTSFTDLAVRVRDVLLGVVPNVQNFANAVADATRKIAGTTGFIPNPGAVGPGGGIVGAGSPEQIQSTGTGTPAAPTIGPGGAPVEATPQTGVNGGGGGDLVSEIRALKGSIEKGNADLMDSLQSQNAQNADQISKALQDVAAQRSQQGVKISVGLDPGTGDVLVSRIEQELQP